MRFPVVLICGTDDHSTACALRLFRAGFRIILAAFQNPVDLHQHRTFTRTVYSGFRTIDGVTARTFSHCIEKNLIPMESSFDQYLQFMLNNNEIATLLIDDLKTGYKIPCDYAVNIDSAVFHKIQPHLNDEVRLVSINCDEASDYLISTHFAYVGRVIYPFDENADEFKKSDLFEKKPTTVINAPIEGVFVASKEINRPILEREEICKINDIPILSPVCGIITGLINSGLMITSATPVAEISPKKITYDARLLPVESFAIAGGVLEAIIFDWRQKTK
ncbi:MAG: hypothetical protein GXO77_16460 [Calditrichaeota bacterium]|nr:hypothetical protein [Calditrichota bacterium]